MHNAEQKKEQTNTKTQKNTMLIKYLYFLGILVVITAILVSFTLLSRKTWQSGLKEQVAQVLQQSKKDTSYTIDDGIDIKTAFSTIGIVFTVKEKGSKTSEYAVLLRVATLYGPLPALFLYTPENEVKFVTFITFGGKAEQQIENISKYSQIAYWSKKVPSIVETGLDKATKGETKK